MATSGVASDVTNFTQDLFCESVDDSDMDRTAVGVALALVGLALLGYGLFLYPDPPKPVYTVDPAPVEDRFEVDGRITDPSSLDPAVRDPIVRAIENESAVTFEAHQVPEYVAYENRTYDLQSVHGDPGGAHFFGVLGTLAAGVVALVTGVVVAFRSARRE